MSKRKKITVGPKGGTGAPPKSRDWTPEEDARYRAEAGGLLAVALQASVTLRIHQLRQRGGPTEKDFARVGPYGQELAEKGDRLLFRGNKPGESAEMFNKLADAIAVMAFVPGGVIAFGTRYESRVEALPAGTRKAAG